jgi:hypothetical protein
MDNNLNIEKEIKNDNLKMTSKNSCPIIIKTLPLSKIKEKIQNNEIFIEEAPSTSPTRTKFKANKRKIANSLKISNNFENIKLENSLFNEESKSDDEENINDQKLEINPPGGGRCSIYTKYHEKNNDEEEINKIFDNSDYIKKLEEKWKYEKILLDYNIIDFTSKSKYF